MATRIIQTRIQNRFDTIEAWTRENPVLLSGEIAFVQINEQQIDSISGDTVNVVTYRLKLGDGEKPFNLLPWLEAPASDVYAWAKSEKPEDVRVTITGNNADAKTLKDWCNLTQDSQVRINTIEDEYIRYDVEESKLFIGKNLDDEIIFDCGNAPI